jgi:hypothetical protein
MDMLNTLYKSIFAPLGVINLKHIKGRLLASTVTVVGTAFLGSVVAPTVYYYVNKNEYDINLNMASMFLGLAVSIFTWVVACTLFWSISKVFNKKIGFGQVASTWGLSYVTNFFCIVLYNLFIIIPEINSGSGFSTFIISSLFIMFLVWKAIYYFMFMRFVINTTLIEFFAFTLISAVVFAVLMIIGFKVGIQVPML